MDARKSFAITFAVSGVASPALAGNWSGPYVGISGGGGWGDQAQHGGILTLPSSGGVSLPVVASSTPSMSSSTISSSTITSSTITSSTITSSTVTSSSFSSGSGDGRYHLSGGLFGGGVGYNWQQERLVYGLEADGSWADISGDGTCGLGGALPHRCGGGIDALGTVRGRIGYDFGHPVGPFGSVMAFAAGGLAVGDIHAWDSLYGNKGSKTLAGWTIGGGIEAMFAQHWSVKLEYLHVDFGDEKVFTAIPPRPERVDTSADIFRVGVNFHFD